MVVGLRHLGLRTRIALAMGGTWLASVAAVMLYMYWAIDHSVVDHWQRERTLLTQELANTLDREIDEIIDDLRMAARLPAMAHLDGQADPAVNGIPAGVDPDKRVVLDALMGGGRYSVLFLLRPNGDHYLSHPFNVQQRLQRFNLSDRPYFQRAVATRMPVASDWFIGADGVPAVAIDVPILGPDNAIKAHLGAVIHLDQLTRRVISAARAPFDLTVLIDGKGKIITEAHGELATGLSSAPLAKELAAFLAARREAGRVELRPFKDPSSGEGGISTMVVLRSGWGLAMARGNAGFVSEVRPQVLRITAIVGIILLLLSSAGFAIADGISDRWEAASRAVEEANDQLEHRVRERTRELEESRLALMAKSDTLETILENISQGISLYDQDLRLVACNRRFLELLDFPPDLACPGARIEDFFRFNATRGEYGPGDIEEMVRVRLEQARRFEPHRTVRARPTGTVIEIIGQPLPSGGHVATYTDITEARRKERSLRTLSRAVEQSPASVVITDPAGVIEYVNPKFVEVTGYSAAEAIGKNPRVLKSGLTPDAVYRDLWRTIAAGRTWEGELQNRKKSGELYWEHASVSPIRAADGTTIQFVAVKEDITLRKQVESELIGAMEAAEEANHAKTVFLSHMSHELRTPLTAVLGYAEMMTLGLAGKLPPSYAEYVDNITTSGRHLLSIIDEMLDVSRIELGSYRLALAEIDLAEVARECVAMMRPQSVEKGISLELTEGRPAVVRSDGRALRQVVVNLLTNAVKYTPEGGWITVSIAPTGDGTEIAVADNGCGIPEGQLTRIFEPFHRIDPLRADPARGVGLGLAICRRITNLLGGDIRIESREGEGTTATVRIPDAA